jgi:glutamate dehydrogenase
VARLRKDLYVAHAGLTEDVLMVTEPGGSERRLAAWAQRNDVALRRANKTLLEIWESGSFTFTTLAVALDAIRSLAAASSLPQSG